MKDISPENRTPIKTFFPKCCAECPFSEHNKEIELVFQCGYYKRSYWGYSGLRPPFCKVEVIAVREKEENKKEQEIPMDKGQIIEKISDHIRVRGGVPSDWYISASQYPRRRLLVSHNVDIEKDKYIFIPANSDLEAKEILDHFINCIGTDGRTGPEIDGAKIVYAYKKSERTNP
jgi:hypothetical protein